MAFFVHAFGGQRLKLEGRGDGVGVEGHVWCILGGHDEAGNTPCLIEEAPRIDLAVEDLPEDSASPRCRSGFAHHGWRARSRHELLGDSAPPRRRSGYANRGWRSCSQRFASSPCRARLAILFVAEVLPGDSASPRRSSGFANRGWRVRSWWTTCRWTWLRLVAAPALPGAAGEPLALLSPPWERCGERSLYHLGSCRARLGGSFCLIAHRFGLAKRESRTGGWRFLDGRTVWGRFSVCFFV